MQQALIDQTLNCVPNGMSVYTKTICQCCLGRKFVAWSIVPCGDFARKGGGDGFPKGDTFSGHERFIDSGLPCDLRGFKYLSSCIVMQTTSQGVEMTVHQPDLQSATEARARWMGILARAPVARLLALMPAVLPGHSLLRVPEAGAVMVTGRMGAVGAPFNLGEMTVTRCVLRLGTGEVGHAHVQGRDKGHATRAALVDAMMQTAEAERVRQSVLEPLAAEEAARGRSRAERAAATRVEFFTLVRGEDA
jgi:alpha-D-ribose 1-methylphosphonate 5-triphosphate synthase subunit PhnG